MTLTGLCGSESQPSALIVDEGLANLVGRVHDEGAVARRAAAELAGYGA